MRRFQFVAACLGLQVLLSGCTGGSRTGEDSEHSVESLQAVFDESRGALEGVVTDESLVPIGGLTIALENAGLPAATSTPNGEFAFSLVEPGTHVLVAHGQGFLELRSRVEIMPGKVTQVALQMRITESDDAFHVTTILEGYLGCSVAIYVRPIDRWQPANVCGIPNLQDKYLVAAPFAGTDVSQLHTLLFETAWRATQLFGSGLNIRISIEGDPPAPSGSKLYQSAFWDVRGTSPLAMKFNRTHLEALGAADPSFYALCNPNQPCHVELATYPWPNTLGGTYPADVGVNLEQRFTHYMSEFYGASAASDFSAIEDS